MPVDIRGWDMAANQWVSPWEVPLTPGGTVEEPPPPPPPGDYMTLAQLRDPANFGVPAGTVYTSTMSASSINSQPPGTTFRNVRFTGTANTDYYITTPDHTFINCRWDNIGVGMAYDGKRLRLERCEFQKITIVSGAANVYLLNCKSYNRLGTDSCHITNDRAGWPPATDITFDGFYSVGDYTTLVQGSGNHYDTIQVRGINGHHLRNCCLDQGTIFDVYFNAPLYWENANGGNTNLLAENCFFRGGGYQHLMISSATTCTIRDCWFPNDTKDVLRGEPNLTQSGNRRLDGTPIANLITA